MVRSDHRCLHPSGATRGLEFVREDEPGELHGLELRRSRVALPAGKLERWGLDWRQTLSLRAKGTGSTPAPEPELLPTARHD